MRLVPFSAVLAFAGFAFGAQPTLESVERIWKQTAPHHAFGDLIRFQNQWLCTFREGLRHVAGGEVPKDDGKIRVLASRDGKAWESLALVEETGIDLRDPHLSVTSDGRLMLVMGGSVYENATYKGRQPRVAFSRDGRTWSRPQRVLREGDWLWRVTWRQGWAWGVAKYGAPGRIDPANPRRADLVRSRDGVRWETVAETKVDGADETTVRFLKDGTMVALMRRVWGERNTAMVGHAKPPYTQWSWKDLGVYVGGPNFIVLPDGTMWAGGRFFRDPPSKDPVTVLARLTLDSYQPVLTLPSRGDNSYPGFVWHNGRLWMSYFSSHEENTAMYLAVIKIQDK